MSFLFDSTFDSSIVRWGRIRRGVSLIGLLGISYTTIGCSTAVNSSAEQDNGGTTAQIEVVSTFAPITSFTKAVVGDRANVTQLLPHNVSPHDYQARPEDVVQLTKADVVIENGLEFEPFLESMIDASENQDVVVIDSSEGIPVDKMAEGAHSDHVPHAAEKEHEEHDHTAEGHDHEGKEHAHDGEEHGNEKSAAQKADKHEGHVHGEHDPHIWLDPKRAIQQVENIRDGLIKADPDGQETYQANAQAYIEQLQALDSEMTKQLQPFQGKAFVTYHDFAHYFAQSYGLTAEFLVGVPSENASPEDVTRVIDAVQASNLKTLLTEPQLQNDPFAALASDLNVSVSQFDPMGTSPSADIQADSYITTMRSNLKNLSAAFSAQTQQSFQLRFQTAATARVAVFHNSVFNPQGSHRW